jgi:hypothetical protein
MIVSSTPLPFPSATAALSDTYKLGRVWTGTNLPIDHASGPIGSAGQSGGNSPAS